MNEVPINPPLFWKIEDCFKKKKNGMQGKDRDFRKGAEQKDKLMDSEFRNLNINIGISSFCSVYFP